MVTPGIGFYADVDTILLKVLHGSGVHHAYKEGFLVQAHLLCPVLEITNPLSLYVLKRFQNNGLNLFLRFFVQCMVALLAEN